LIARVSPTNRPCLESYLKAKRSAGLKTATLEQSAYILGLVDELTPGRAFLDLKPDDLRDVLEALATQRAASTAYVYAAVLKAFYAWANPDGIPPAIRRALRRKAPELVAQEPVLTRDEFGSLLIACETRHGVNIQTASRAHCCQMQALLWVLWDTGFRISEALALRVGDFKPAKDGGAHLPLPRQEETPLPLKTGQRALATYVVDCVPAIQTWLPFHPLRDDFTAPLFPSQRNPRRAVPDATLARFFEKLGERAGVPRAHPHLFRHTRATRAAEAGWNEAQLCAYFSLLFGWGSCSGTWTNAGGCTTA
jgi:integrase